MGSLFAVIVAIVAHSIAQGGLGALVGGDVEGAGWMSAPGGVLERPWMLAAALPLPLLMSLASRRSSLRGRPRLARLWLLAAEHSGWALFTLVLFGAGWLDTVRRWTGSDLSVDGWPDMALALSFVPFIAYQLLAIDAAVRAQGGTPPTMRALRGFQTRMFLAFVAPIAAFVIVSAALGNSEWLRVQVEHVRLASALFTALMVAGLALMLPALLRWAWDTVPFPAGPHRDLLDHVASKAAFRPRDLRIWRTGDLIANAAILGFGPTGRTVFFSDQLLSMLNARQLCAVYAHEIGHARRGHAAIFIGWLLAFVLLGDLAVSAVHAAYGGGWATAAGVAIAAAWYVSFGWLSRRYELDADLFSYSTLEDLPALRGALELVSGGRMDRGGWRHFSVARRIRFLERVADEPPFAAGFKRRLRAFSIAGLALAVVGAGLQLVDLTGHLPRDRAVASLARGQYQRASSLASLLEGEDDEDVRRLAEAAIRVNGTGLEDVEQALRSALRARDLGGAESLAELAVLRGSAAAEPIATVLERAVGGARRTPAMLEGIDLGWHQDLRSALGLAGE